MSTSAVTIQDEKFKSLELQKTVVNKEQVCCYSRGLGAASEKNPILVLLHGYPQSSYMWRHLIPLLPSNAPVFALDLPGYGASAPIENNDKLSVGQAVIAALKTEVKRTSTSSSSAIPIVLIGHDRGARIAHHLTVNGVVGFDIVGACLIDIVPTARQWESASNAPDIVGFFHWPLLANVDLATRMLNAFGPENWCREMILRWAGNNPTGLSTLKSDSALSVYESFFAQPHTVIATNKDYEAGATVDVEREKKNQAEGRKIERPLLLVYSESYIGKRYDWPEVWRDWVAKGVNVRSLALEDGIGHFGAEEAPKETAVAINEWLKEEVVRSE